MTVTLYNITDDPRKLTKTLPNPSESPTEAKTYNTVDALDIVSVVNPTLILSYDGDYIDCNYCYVHEFGRYYFCKTSVDTGGRLVLTCTVDPLMSFADDIKECKACITRNEYTGIGYVVDNKLPVDPNRFTYYGDPLPRNGFNDMADALHPGKNYLVIING